MNFQAAFQVFIKSLILVLGSFLILTFTSEAGYRILEWARLRKGGVQFLLADRPLYQFDSDLGYRYVANQSVTARWVERDGSLFKTNQIVTNESGNIAKSDDQARNTTKEYRIAIIGDSMVAGIHSATPWPTVLEKKLNNNAELKRLLSVERFKVINAGRDGIGLVQMSRVFSDAVKRFHPDEIIVSFISADIYRKFIWRGTVPLEKEAADITLTCTQLPISVHNPNCLYADFVSLREGATVNAETMIRVRQAAAKKLMEKINWFSGYPQFLSWALAGNLEKYIGRNPYRAIPQSYSTPEESLAFSARAIREMKQVFPKTAFVLNPTLPEMEQNVISALAASLMQTVPEVKITPMLEYLPEGVSGDTIRSWTNHPHDEHWNERGVEIYATAIFDFFKSKKNIPPRLSRRVP